MSGKITQEFVNRYIEDNNLQPLTVKIEKIVELVEHFDKKVDEFCAVTVYDAFESPHIEAAFNLIDFMLDEVGIGDWLGWWLYEVSRHPSSVYLCELDTDFLVKDIRDLVFVARYGERV